MAIPSDDEIYAQIAEELAAGYHDKALWTRAFMEKNGDPARTQARYIKLRRDAIIQQARAEQEHLETLALLRQRQEAADRRRKLFAQIRELPIPMRVGYVLLGGLWRIYRSTLPAIIIFGIAAVIVTLLWHGHGPWTTPDVIYWLTVILVVPLLVIGIAGLSGMLAAAIPYGVVMGVRHFLAEKRPRKHEQGT